MKICGLPETSQKACVFRETTFYLLFEDGSLTMFDHFGRPIRKFEGRVNSVHSGRGGLYVSVRPKCKADTTTGEVSEWDNQGEFQEAGKSSRVENCTQDKSVLEPHWCECNDQVKNEDKAQKSNRRYEDDIQPKSSSNVQIYPAKSNEIATYCTRQTDLHKTQNVFAQNIQSGTESHPNKISTERKSNYNQNSAQLASTSHNKAHDTSICPKRDSKFAKNLVRNTTGVGDPNTESNHPNSSHTSQNRQENYSKPYGNHINHCSFNHEIHTNSEQPINSAVGAISSYERIQPPKIHSTLPDTSKSERNARLLRRLATSHKDRETERAKQITQNTSHTNPHKSSTYEIGLNVKTLKIDRTGSNKLTEQSKPNKITINNVIKQSKNDEGIMYFTDFLMNVTEEIKDITIVLASRHGVLYNQNGQTFMELKNAKVRCDSCEFDLRANRIAICSTYVLTICGLVDKKVCYYDFELTQNLNDLKEHKPVVLQSFKASPMAVPHVVVTDERDPYVCVKAEIGHFTKIFVYADRQLVFENTHETEPGGNYFFVDDFLVKTGLRVNVYPLTDFESCWSVDMNLSSSRILGKRLLSPLYPNCFAAHDTSKAILEFFHVDGEARAISKMGGLDKVAHMDECFSSYGYHVDSKNQIHIYNFHPD